MRLFLTFLFHIGILGALWFTFAPPAQAAYYLYSWEDRHLPQKILFLSPEVRYYSTDANYDSRDTAVIPTGFKSYSRMQGDLYADYGLTSKLTVFGRLSWASITAKHEITALGGTAYGLSDQQLGANYRVWESPGGIALDAQLETIFAAYSNATARTKALPYLGDGSTDITLGAFAAVPIDSPRRRWWVVGGAGHTWRTNQFSSAFPWSVILRHRAEGNGIVASLGFAGTLSRKTDKSSLVGAGLGGADSFAINAVNPSLVNFKSSLGYQVDKQWTLLGLLTYALTGSNAPRGWSIGAGAQIYFGRGSSSTTQEPFFPEESSSSSDPAVKPKQASNKGFLNYATKATVSRVNDRLNIIKIDKGQDNGVLVGQTFDIFAVKSDGAVTEAVARAKVTDVKPNEAALKITEYFKEIWVEEGFIARRLIE